MSGNKLYINFVKLGVIFGIGCQNCLNWIFAIRMLQKNNNHDNTPSIRKVRFPTI